MKTPIYVYIPAMFVNKFKYLVDCVQMFDCYKQTNFSSVKQARELFNEYSKDGRELSSFKCFISHTQK